jgi:hypothetical protein
MELVGVWPLPTVSDLSLGEVSGLLTRRTSSGQPAWLHGETYVPRAVDDLLVDLLRTQRFVLVTGAAGSGKTRTAFEAARRALPDYRVVIPRGGHSLAALADLDPALPPTAGMLLVLDDLDQYLRGPAWDAASRLLLRPTSATKVLATCRADTWHRLHDLAPSAERTRSLLHLFEASSVTLPLVFDGAERAAAGRLYPHERFTHGLAEHLAARELLVGHGHLERYDHGVQRPSTVGATGQFHLDQVAEAGEGLFEVAAGGAEPAELEAAGGVLVAVADEGGNATSGP